jgi:hypothetical protein
MVKRIKNPAFIGASLPGDGAGRGARVNTGVFGTV